MTKRTKNKKTPKNQKQEEERVDNKVEKDQNRFGTPFVGGEKEGKNKSVGRAELLHIKTPTKETKT